MKLPAGCVVVLIIVLDAVVYISSRRSTESSLSSMGGTGSFGGRSSEDRKRMGILGNSAPHRTRTNRWRHGFLRESKTGKKYPLLKDRKPNIILIVTDDQDVELGSMNYMPKALRILRDSGTHFANSFVTTPMCCPSRSSMLTGMYVHNHHVFTNNDNCSSPYWQQTHETRTFATYLNNAGYRTGYFGKYLNEYNGTYIPPGWREWAGLIRNSRFYNYSINVNGLKIKHGDDYYKDYYPDLITNDSISFLRQSKQLFVNKPVMMVLSYPSPHGPEDAAPQYQHLFNNVTTHRTTSWNYAPNLDKQWILRQTGQMESIHVEFTDLLHRKRLQTLQSVDDALERLYEELKELGELNNTYIFYTSDHGYHLGQFGLVKGKAMPFEFDIKVPLYVRGPNVPHGIKISNAVLNLDLAPTFLDIAGIEIPDHMDGKSIMKLLIGANELARSNEDKEMIEKRMMKKRTWRDTFLVESAGKLNAGGGEKKKKNPLKPDKYQPDGFLSELPGKHPSVNKEQRLSEICQRHEYQSPCKQSQKWECYYDGLRWRMQKCRPYLKKKRRLRNNCICPETTANVASLMDPHEKRRQRAFLRDHVSKGFKPQFIGTRGRRSPTSEFDLSGVHQLNDILQLKYKFPELEVVDSLDSSRNVEYRKSVRSTKTVPSTQTGCQLTQKSAVNCSDDVYSNMGTWRENKNYVDTQIKYLKEKLGELKDIRKHLKLKRPGTPFYGKKNKESPLGPFTKLDTDYDSPEDLENANQDCICDMKPFGRKNGRRKGGRRDEIREERRRQKEERMRRRQEKLKRQERKNRRKQKYENYTCNIEKMNCFVHDNDHWKTAPFWTGFLSFYDMTKDPYQLHNVIQEVPFSILNQLHHQLLKLKSCKGAKDCTVRSRIVGEDRFGHLTDSRRSLFTGMFGENRPLPGRQTSSLPGKANRQESNSGSREKFVEEEEHGIWRRHDEQVPGAHLSNMNTSENT